MSRRRRRIRGECRHTPRLRHVLPSPRPRTRSSPLGALTRACTLRFDRRLSRPCTWRLNETADGIEARVTVASGPDVTVNVKLRWRQAKAPDLVFCRQIDEHTLCLEGSTLDPALPRMEYVLLDAPAETAAALRLL
jgi:hypothetical protein